MEVTVYILCYNEQLLLPFTIGHYRTMFPGCRIVIYDNYSTDKSVELATALGCEIKMFDTQNQISDLMYQWIKNNCWKTATTEWVAVVDCDELMQINAEQLKEEAEAGYTIISSEGYNLVNLEDNLDIPSITHGYRDNDVCQFYDKSLLFNKKYITEMNYIIGAHSCLPHGRSDWTKNKYKLLHYHYISPSFMVERFKVYKSRLSQENLENSWGARYLETEGTIRLLFEEYRKKSKKIL